MLSQVKAVEQMLQTESSEHINDTLTNAELQTAAEMFIYLNTCPSVFKSWFLFYKDLFLTKTADHIILTLNRMLKTSQDKDGEIRAEKLLKKSASLLSLNNKEIRSIHKAKKLQKESDKNFIVPKGTHSFTKSFNLNY